MTDQQLRAFLTLLMCCDPWPVDSRSTGGDENQDHMICLADVESAKRGYGGWIEAYYDFNP